jgi:hypothetical protein
MTRSIIAVLLCAALTLACLSPEASGQEKARKGFLSVLKEGQSVVLKESAGRYEITLMDGGHKVIEVGPDYVVVEDLAGVTETRIPIYSIKSIARIKGPKR